MAQREVSRGRRIALGLAGISVLLLAWEVLGRAGALGVSWPPLSTVVSAGFDERGLMWDSMVATTTAAVKGFLIGTFVAYALAVTGLLLPRLRPGIGRLATVVNSVPWLALGPFLIMVVAPDLTPVVIAAMAVFFASFVSVSSGLESASEAHNDVFTVFGASKFARLRRLQVPAALPSLIDGAKLGAPAALLGAIFGEWFGASSGLGLLIISSMQLFLPERLWAAAGLAALMAMVAYGAFGVLQYRVEKRFKS
jgi:ABC-type nitrate/sulfonate/bicarbonate transport system permease component